MSSFPNQMVSRTDKEKDDFRFCKDTINSIIDNTGTSNFEEEFKVLFDAYDGSLTKVDYNHITNPLNTENSKYTRFPAKLRNYNILKPVIDLLLGEKPNRNYNYMVKVNNTDSKSIRDEMFMKAMRQYFQQKLINEFAKMGIDIMQGEQPLPEVEAFQQDFNTNYRDSRAIQGQEVINVLEDELKLSEKFQEGFFDYLVTGHVYSHKYPRHKNVTYEIIPGGELYYPDYVSEKFIQDMPWVYRKSFSTLSQILDKFYDVLSEEDINKIKYTLREEGIGGTGAYALRDMNELIPVYHVTWKSMRKIGFLTYYDEYGIEQEMQVSEDYPVSDEETIEWRWVNESWEGYRIGDKDDGLFLLMQPCPVQMRKMDSLSECVLPYNGRRYLKGASSSVSAISIGIPYQILYNIIHYQIESAIVKNKGKIALLDYGMIPRQYGWDDDRFMYSASVFGFAFVDSTAENPKQERINFSNNTVLDLSMGEFINTGFNLLVAIKQEWEDSFGINRQRKGNVMASDKVGSTERAVFQSSVMTEELFRKYEEFESLEITGLLNVAQVAWKDGKHGMYVTSNQQQVFYEIEPQSFALSEFGMFITNAGKEKTKLDTLKQLANMFAQNSGSPYTIAEILDAENFSTIKKVLKEFEEKQAAMEQQQQQAQIESQEKLEKIRIEDREDNQAFAAYQADLQRKHEVQLKLMDKVDNDPAEETDNSEEIEMKKHEDIMKLENKKIEVNKELKLKEIAAKKESDRMKNKRTI